MKTRILTPEEWPLIAPLLGGTFRDAMPTDPNQSAFHAAFDGERLAAFLNIETVYHFNDLYVAPAYRQTSIAWRLMKEADSLLQQVPGSSAIVLTDEPRVARLTIRLGATDRGLWRMYRKDY